MRLSIKKPPTKSQKKPQEKGAPPIGSSTGPDPWAEIVQDAQAGLLALSVRVGLQTLQYLMATEVEGLVGPKGQHNPDRTAVRHGVEDG